MTMNVRTPLYVVMEHFVKIPQEVMSVKVCHKRMFSYYFLWGFSKTCSPDFIDWFVIFGQTLMVRCLIFGYQYYI